MIAKKQISEIIMKFLFAVIGFTLAVYIFKDIISMVPLFNSSLNEDEIYTLISTTSIGNVFSKLGAVEVIDKTLIYTTIVAFLDSIPIFNVIYLALVVLLTILYFVYPKWNLLKMYLKMAYVIIALYIFKFVLYGLVFVCFFKDNIQTLVTCLITGNIIFIFFSLGEIFILSLWVLKLLLNITNDIKELINNWYLLF